jgi:hypothetical protein
MNQYRCETCNHCKKDLGWLPYCIKNGRRLQTTFTDMFGETGCASHSDFQSERDTISKELALELCMDARKDVREKVLDELEEWTQNKWYRFLGIFPYNSSPEKDELLKKIAELRQAGEP